LRAAAASSVEESCSISRSTNTTLYFDGSIMTARSTSARRSASEYSRSGLSPQARTSRGWNSSPWSSSLKLSRGLRSRRHCRAVLLAIDNSHLENVDRPWKLPTYRNAFKLRSFELEEGVVCRPLRPRSLPSAWQGRHYTRAAGRPFFGFACPLNEVDREEYSPTLHHLGRLAIEPGWRRCWRVPPVT
jgi:hypothetical protein